MELTPQLLTDEIDFRIAVRGYDRHEVDDFLERVAVAVGQLQSQLTKAVARAKTAEARVAELEGGSGVAAREAQPETEAVSPVPESSPAAAETSTPKAPPSAPVPVVGGDEDLNEELRRTLVLAQRTADAAIREAHEEARQIVEEANEEARRNREAADAAHAKARDEAHSRLVAEIRDLEATRESMRDDTVILERYLGTERARVRETIQVLRRLVDEPESFRTAEVPELSGATTPAALGPAPAATEDAPSAGGEAEDDGDAGDAGGSTETAGATVPEGTGDAGATEATGEEGGEAASAEGGSGPDEPDTAPAGRPAPDDATTSDAGTVGGEAPPLAQRVPGSTAAGETEESATEPSPAAPDEAEPGRAQASGSATTSDTEELGQLFSSSESAKDWRAAGSDRGDQGPHTQPVAAARFEEESDEAFLAELRRAMNDDEPLGPDDKR